MRDHFPLIFQVLLPRRKSLKKFYFVLGATGFVPMFVKGLVFGFLEPFTGYLTSLSFFFLLVVGYFKAYDFVRLTESLTSEEAGAVDSLLGSDAGKRFRMNIKRNIDNRRREYFFSLCFSLIVAVAALFDYFKGIVGSIDGIIVFPWTYIIYVYTYFIWIGLFVMGGSAAYTFIHLIRGLYSLSSDPSESGLEISINEKAGFQSIQQEITSILALRQRLRPIFSYVVSLSTVVFIGEIFLLLLFSYNLMVRGFLDYIVMYLLLIAGALALLPSFLPQYSFHKLLTNIKREILFKVRRMRIQAETSSLLSVQRSGEMDLEKASSFRAQALALRDLQKEVDEVGTWIYEVRELRTFISITQAPVLLLAIQIILSSVFQ